MDSPFVEVSKAKLDVALSQPGLVKNDPDQGRGLEPDNP